MLEPYLMWIRITVLALVFGAGWMVNQWRWEAAVADQKQEAATVLQTKTDEVRVAEREQAVAADKMDKADADQKQQIAAEGERNRDVVDRTRVALDRVHQSRRGEGGGRPVSGAPAAAGGAASRSADRERADRCEALLAEGADLLGEGGVILRDLSRDHDLAAQYGRIGHDWALKVAAGTHAQ